MGRWGLKSGNPVFWEYLGYPTLGRWGENEIGMRVLAGFGSGPLRVFAQDLSAMMKGAAVGYCSS